METRRNSNADEMTPRERVLTAIRNGQPDRVPVLPAYQAGMMSRAHCRFSECFSNGDTFVAAAVKCYEDLGFDGIFDFGMPPMIAEAAGATLVIAQDNPPVPGEPVVKTYDDLDALQPRDVRSKGRVPHLLSIISRMRKALGPDVAIVASGPIPFRIADCMRGTQGFYKDLIRNPAFVKRLVDFGVQPCIEYAEAAIEAGADMLMIPDALSGKTAISRKHYEEFNYPYAKKVFDALNAKGIPYWLHTCGDWSDRFDLATEGPPCLHLAAEADLAQLKSLYGSKISFAGNVSSVDVMLLGSVEDVTREARRCIERGAPGGGFILSADCAVPPATPEQNLHALVAAAREYGRY
ncbi:MAG: uroporphyrinogen decarboxylase family protein [Chloroflexi bacterium]|nr:uroporphyrinogen decarboxylase family protein [Chloroflexota bacterium]